MRKIFATLATAAVLLSAGCGGKSYELRLEKTLDAMKYRKRLDDNLMPPAKGKFEQLSIYLRPPKPLAGPAKEFQLAVLEPGKFDLTESFYEPEKQALHVLARVKKPKGPPGKKAAPTAADTATRGEFNSDVAAVLTGVYGVEIDPAKAKEDAHKSNRFKGLTFEANDKIVNAYLYGSKTNPYEVALIFEYAKSEKATLASKIDLTLGSFAVGERAKREFNGTTSEEESGEGGTGAAPVAF